MASGIVSQGQDLVQATGAALSYIAGQCTRFVAETLSWIPANLGNAYQWLGGAQARGLPTIGPTAAPPVGAVAVWGQSPSMPFGHVAEVVGQIPGGFQVAEENFIGAGITDIRDVTNLSGISGFILPPSLAPQVAAGQFVGGQLAGAAAAPISSVAGAITAVPTQIGHGLANAAAAGLHDLGAFLRNLLPALVVALLVALVLFGGHG